mmetsp:Transcript_6721/g.14624  ORF Transcript_6721/g.14624 Transcript_6721/m.14624 type:complete len:150 (-) Transcript_6721:4-453(-)
MSGRHSRGDTSGAKLAGAATVRLGRRRLCESLETRRLRWILTLSSGEPLGVKRTCGHSVAALLLTKARAIANYLQVVQNKSYASFYLEFAQRRLRRGDCRVEGAETVAAEVSGCAALVTCITAAGKEGTTKAEAARREPEAARRGELKM